MRNNCVKVVKFTKNVIILEIMKILFGTAIGLHLEPCATG